MQILPYPITEKDTNKDNVRILHEALKALDKNISDEEYNGKQVSNTTTNSVKLLKAELGIPTQGSLLVDHVTSDAVTVYLKRINFFDNVFSVSGKVVNEYGDGIQAEVRIYDIRLRGISIFYKNPERIDELTFENGFRSLSEIISSKKGQYAVTFFCDTHEKGERKLPDLVAVATKGLGIVGWSRLVLEEDFTTDGIILNLDIQIQKEKGAPDTEFARIYDLVNKFLAESDLKTPDLYDSPQQVVFTARELNLDPAHVAYFVAAHECSFELSDSDQYHQLLYGLGRQGHKLFLPAFFNKKRQTLLSDIKAAISEKIIEGFGENVLETFSDLLLEKSLNAALKYKNAEGKHPVNDYLSVLFTDEKQKKAYLEAWQNHKPGEKFEEELNARFKPRDIDALKFKTRLSVITGNNLELANKVFNTGKSKPEDLVAIQVKDWKKLIKGTNIPEAIPGEDEKKIENYANGIVNTLASLYPTEKIKWMLGAGELKFKDKETTGKVLTFLKEKNIDIQKPFKKILNNKNWPALDESQKETLKLQRIYQVSSTPKIMQVLLDSNLDSAHKIASIPRKIFVKTYSKDMEGEAAAFATHERACFISSRCAMAWREIDSAVKQPVPALAKLGKAANKNKPAARAVAGETLESKEEKVDVNSDETLNYANLFESPDICECEHCRSMYSASAYFVELMLFLKNSGKNGVEILNDEGVGTGKFERALHVLLKRRPDLQYLELSCENSETEIPYIDLANEVMESYILHINDDEKVKAFNNAEISKAELRLEPQQLHVEVYRTIASAKYPFTLPYHLPLDIIRTHGEQLGVSRFEVMKIMRKNTKEDFSPAIIAESLKLSPEEYEYISGKKFNKTETNIGTEKFFGLRNEVQLEALSGAREVLQRTGLKYTELVDLLKTTFINPGWPVFNFLQNTVKDSGIPPALIYAVAKFIKNGRVYDNKLTSFLNEFKIGIEKWEEYYANVVGLLYTSEMTEDEWTHYITNNLPAFDSIITLYNEKSECAIDETVLHTLENVYAKKDRSGIDAPRWLKIYRFIRLWRKLGWTMPELDHVLRALQIREINPEALRKLSYVKQLQQVLKTDVHTLAVLWGDVDTNADNNQFKKLFLNKTVLNLSSGNADAWKNYLNKGKDNPLLKGNIPAIVVALGFSEEDWSAISDEEFLSKWIYVDLGGQPVETVNWKLSLPVISTFYRIKIVSNLTGYSIPDLRRLMRCFDLPLSGRLKITVEDDWNKALPAFDLLSPEKNYEKYVFLRKIREAGFTVDELEYILSGTVPATANFGLSDEKLAQICKSATEAIKALDQTYPAGESIVVTSQILTAVLLALYRDKNKDVAIFVSLLQSVYSFNRSIDTQVDDLDIADDLKLRISYNKETGLLVLTGMPDVARKDEVTGFSGNPSYKNAIQDYYNEVDGIRTTFSGLFGDRSKIDELLVVPEPGAIIEVYDGAIQKLKEKLKPAIIIRALSGVTGLTEETVKTLVSENIRQWETDIAAIYPGEDAEPVKENLAVFKGKSIPLHRASLLISKLRLSDAEITYMKANSGKFEQLDFLSLKKEHIVLLMKFAELKKGIPEKQATLFDVLRPLPDGEQNKKKKKQKQLSAATGWATTLIRELQKHFGFDESGYQDVGQLMRMKKAIMLIQKTKLPAKAVIEWGGEKTDFDALYKTAQLIRTGVKSIYSEKDWLELGAQLSDKIREHKRDALIAYLLTIDSIKTYGELKDEEGGIIKKGIESADGLFQYFLLDVQMGKCMDTSRIVQASAAIQLFINRCLLGMESRKNGNEETGVSPDMIDQNRWEWMQYYRVWEVNRKIFLYPENWLMPEWRTERSSFFKELESELTQNDITDRNVETAFRNYLTKMNEVANLEVCGMWKEKEDGDTLKFIHVFARTRNAPHQVYYRKWEAEYDKWLAWEKVNVDIRHVDDGENSGVHLLPVVWNNRLFLFWPEFMEKSGSDEHKNLIKNWEIRLAWTEYVDGKWLPKQLSNMLLILNSKATYAIRASSDVISVYEYGNIQYLKQLRLQSRFDDSGLYIEVLFSKFNLQFGVKKSFSISDVGQFIRKEEGLNSSYIQDEKENQWKNYYFNFNTFHTNRSSSKLEFETKNILKNECIHALLLPASTTSLSKNMKSRMFFSSLNRTYFVKPVINSISKWKKLDNFGPLPGVEVEFNGEPIERFDREDIFDPGFRGPIPGDRFKEDINVVAGIFSVPDFKSPLANIQPIAVSGVAETIQWSQHKVEPQLSTPAGKISAGTGYRLVGAYQTQTGIALQGFKSGFIEQVVPVEGLQFNTFHHPYTGQLITNLNKGGVTGLMESDTLRKVDNNEKLEYGEDYQDIKEYKFSNLFDPNFDEGLVEKDSTRFKENISFDSFNANSIYNWELFYHAPLYIALRLSKNGKYKEALKWFHYIFNPTTDKMDLPGEEKNARFWELLPFKTTVNESLREILLRYNSSEGEHEDIKEWRDKPFQPHIVAGKRPIAYMKFTVLKYVENLLDWGDSLFRQFTRETVNEALHLYVIANEILGEQPEFVPKRGNIKAETFNTLDDKLDALGNALVIMENIMPYSGDVTVSAKENTSPNFLGYGPAFYFCIPNNEEMLKYWDRAADRLYKIRHCMDIDGVERQLALFAPPIDPAMLINAAAQGLSIGDILASLGTPSPLYRFSYMLQKANEFCNDVKSLGGALLSALEKKDGEEISRLRAAQETGMLELMTQIKERQVLDARLTREGLLKSRETAALRLEYYQSLLSNEKIKIPALPEIDADVNGESQTPADTTLAKLKPDVNTDLVDNSELVVDIDNSIGLIEPEAQQLEDSRVAVWWQQTATVTEAIAGVLHALPDFEIPTPAGPVTNGGSHLGHATSALAKIPQIISSVYSYYANKNGQMASYIRREQEWTLQANLASREIIQLDKQITSADIKIQVAKKELENHKKQIENNKNIELYMKEKFTSQELYEWMKDQLVAVYKQSFDMAFDMSKKAEICYRRELGKDTDNFIQYGHWDNIKQGLCAGEKLQLNLRQMEKAYIENNRRQFEITQHFSMLQIAPEKLMELKINGQCSDFSIPEAVFDLMYPGYYRRVIKSVRISMPCIAGPYTNVGATLTLGSSKLRKTPNTGADKLEDSTFNGHRMIATSNAQNDGGQFELNFRDERYLPFEGAGAVSTWTLSLPAAIRPFDYNTISDVVFHISYTADYDGNYKSAVEEQLKNALSGINGRGLERVFSIRQDFPNEWRLLNSETNAGDTVITFRREHFPFFANANAIKDIGSTYLFDNSNTMRNGGRIIEKDGFGVKILKSDLDFKELSDIVFIVAYECVVS